MSLQRKMLHYVLAFLIVASPIESIRACPFCSAVSQTLRQEMAAMDTVAIAHIVAGSESDSDARFLVTSVVRGDDLVRTKQELKVNYFGKAKTEQSFLLMGVDPPNLLWSSPLPVSDVAIKYVNSINSLPEESLQRLKFYLKFLEHDEPLLARDAYDEFASAPYSEIKLLKDDLKREQLIAWIKDTSLPPDRKRLYLVMLGVCGESADADLLEEMLRSEEPNRRAGLDAMIACYATLKGEDGLGLIDELFLENKKSQYADTYSAIMALRFHGTDGGVIEKDRVLESMRLILDRPELADLVIPDLARWEDWTQIKKLAELFKTADDKSSWVRVPVINYLRACPLPEAEEQLAELKELDPSAYKRATSFFPVPKASSSSTDSSSQMKPASVRNIASDVESAISEKPYASARKMAAVTGLAPTPIAAAEPNRLVIVSVVSMVSATLWLMMWLAISGTGGSSALLMALVRTENAATK